MNNTNLTKEVIRDVLNSNGFEIVPTHTSRFNSSNFYDKVKTKGNKGGLVYVDIPANLNDLSEFLNDYTGTKTNVVEYVERIRNSNTIAFENWLSDNGYKPTNGTFTFPSGLTDYHTKEGVYYSTTKLCIEYNDNK